MSLMRGNVYESYHRCSNMVHGFIDMSWSRCPQFAVRIVKGTRSGFRSFIFTSTWGETRCSIFDRRMYGPLYGVARSSESKSEKRNCQSPLSQSHRLANGKMEIVFIVVDKCNFGEFDYRTTLSLHTASYGFFLTPPFFNKESQISHPAAICYRGRRNFVVPFTWWYVCFRIWTLRYCA